MVIDYTPILSGAGKPIKRSRFRFEIWSLQREDFASLVRKAWNSPVYGRNSIDIWQQKVRCFRKSAKRLEHKCGGLEYKKGRKKNCVVDMMC